MYISLFIFFLFPVDRSPRLFAAVSHPPISCPSLSRPSRVGHFLHALVCFLFLSSWLRNIVRKRSRQSVLFLFPNLPSMTRIGYRKGNSKTGYNKIHLIRVGRENVGARFLCGGRDDVHGCIVSMRRDLVRDLKSSNNCVRVSATK